jgi:hypothetical protein
VGEAEIHVSAIGILTVGDESRQVVKDHRQVNVGLHESAVDNVLPNLTAVLAESVQRAPQAIVVELGRWYAQRMHEHCAAQPIRNLVKRARSYQPVENQHHSYCAVIDLGSGRAVAVDDLTYVEHLQQPVQHRQSAQVMASLRTGQQVYDLGHRPNSG